MNIQEFRSTIHKTGVAKNNLFFAQITPPSGLNMGIVRDLPFLCKATSMPGFDITTSEVKKQGWGHKSVIPSDYQKGSLSLIIMVDSNFAVKAFFHRWMDLIMNFNTSNGTNSIDSTGKYPFSFSFKERYIGTVDVTMFSENTPDDSSKQYTYKFINAFPVTLSPVELAWENQAEVFVMTVNFAYHSMVANGSGATAGVAPSTAIQPGTRDLITGVLNRPQQIQDITNNFSNTLQQFNMNQFNRIF